jgi:hypothetical protein
MCQPTVAVRRFRRLGREAQCEIDNLMRLGLVLGSLIKVRNCSANVNTV